VGDFPNARQLNARGWIKPVGNGGSQPHMFDTEEGEYVVKARNNRQQSIQVLANELAGGLC